MKILHIDSDLVPPQVSLFYPISEKHLVALN